MAEANKDIIELCKSMGCCDACCLRYLGCKHSYAYENSREYLLKYQKSESSTNDIQTTNAITNSANGTEDEPAVKRCKVAVCVSCLGILQEDMWPESVKMVQDVLEKKRYECSTFACALSAPITTILREKAIVLRIMDLVKDYDPQRLIALKEAWKWSFGVQLAPHIRKTLDSGAVSPLLITLNLEYPDDLQELEILKTLSPSLFEMRSTQKRRFTVEFTRRSVEQALETVTLEALAGVPGWCRGTPSVGQPVRCVSVVCVHAPTYLGGRYVKLSRELPQTPWFVSGKRMMDSSVQELIFEPIAKLYGLSPEEVEHRLKFMSAGREDVDVRCLGEGRPFAIEITDPQRELTGEELGQACELISEGGKVKVRNMVHVTREDLTELKKGEQSKCKTYEALCIKLSHSENDDQLANGENPIRVTEKDIENIKTYRNTQPGDDARIVMSQRTPIRVLHRRPLLTRTRRIYQLTADPVPGHPQLFTIEVCTEAGTYIKEWVHGDLMRSKPSLGDAIHSSVDILALDVARVHLDWPRLQ